jgi:hypothetical protein
MFAAHKLKLTTKWYTRQKLTIHITKKTHKGSDSAYREHKFSTTWYTILKERRTQVYTDPRKQHIAYTIFCGCEHANGVEQFKVWIYSPGANRPLLEHKIPPHKRHATQTTWTHLLKVSTKKRKYQNQYPQPPPTPQPMIVHYFRLFRPLASIFFHRWHSPAWQDPSATHTPHHRTKKGNTYHTISPSEDSHTLRNTVPTPFFPSTWTYQDSNLHTALPLCALDLLDYIIDVRWLGSHHHPTLSI